MSTDHQVSLPRTSNWVRQTHRWTSIVFTLTVVGNFIAMAAMTPPLWVSYLALPPLFLLLVTGVYLFTLPYRTNRNR